MTGAFASIQLPTRRALLSGGLAALGSACGRRKGTGYPGYALVAASAERAIAVVDLTRFRHIKNISLTAEPKALIAGPAGQVFALTPQSGAIHQLAPDLRLLSSHRLADTLTAAMLSPDSRSILAISTASRELLVADNQSLRVHSRYRFSTQPAYLTVGAPDYAAISTGKARTVEIIQLSSGKRWKREMPGIVGKLIFRADGQLLLAANLQDRSLIAFSVPALDVVAELPLAMQPDNLCFGAGGGQLFISGEGMDGIAIVFPYRVLQVDQTVLAGRDPGIMTVSGAPPYLFVASASGSDIAIMDIDSRRVIALVDVAQQPGFLTVTPDNQYALALNEISGDMAVIHVAAIRRDFLASSHKAGAALFTMLPVGDRPVHAIVVPRAS